MCVCVCVEHRLRLRTCGRSSRRALLSSSSSSILNVDCWLFWGFFRSTTIPASKTTMPSARSMRLVSALVLTVNQAAAFVFTGPRMDRAITRLAQHRVCTKLAVLSSAGSTGTPVAPPAVAARIADLALGSELEGTVRGITDFGVFVDVGCETDGLVHKSQLGGSFTPNVAVLGFEQGQKVSCKGI